MQNLEKALKKSKIVLTILIIVLILLLLYTIILAGDVNSAITKTERNYLPQLTELDEAKQDIQEDTESFETKIAEAQEEIAQLQADIAAIENGTYVAD